MSPIRCLAVLVALAAGMVAAPPSYADQPRPHTYRAQGVTPLESPPVQSRELTARVANLAAPGNRAAGMPVPTSPAYARFGTATFNMDFQTGYVTVSGTLGAAPPPGDLPRLAVQAGRPGGRPQRHQLQRPHGRAGRDVTGYSPVSPSMDSRSRSRWPQCREYS